ncbi:MAG: restriction endonuclease subunit S [Clostridia bacterium]|nr:restriction endonuclease subunit S [Clostridia bacterium]
MRIITKKVSEISNHKYMRFDGKYWMTKQSIVFQNYSLIKDVFEIINGSVQTSHYVSEKTEFPYVRIGDIDYKYGIDGEDMLYLDNLDDVNDEKILRRDDLVLATIGATVGKIGLVSSCEGGTHSNNTVVLRAKSNDTAEARFYEKLFQTNLFIKYFFGVVSQKAQPNLQEYDLKNICVPIVSRKCIREALEAISPIEEKIQNLKLKVLKTQEIIDQIIASTFSIDYVAIHNVGRCKKQNASFSTLGNKNVNLRFSYRWNKATEIQNYLISKVNSCKKLGSFILNTQNGWSPECDDSKSEYQVLGIDSINKDGILSFANVKYSDVHKRNFDSYIVKDGDFFVSRGNTTDLVSLASIARINIDEPITIFPDLMIRITFSEEINKEYMAFIFNSFIGRLYFKYSTKGKNQTMVKVSPRELNDFYVPIPNQDTQKNIVDAIHCEISKQDEIKSEIAKLRVKIDEIIESTIRSAD